MLLYLLYAVYYNLVGYANYITLIAWFVYLSSSGNLFGKPEGEDAFAFSFPSDSSTHTFGAGKDDFSFPFSFEQDQNPTPSSAKDFSSSSQSTTQFTLFWN